MVGSPYDDVLRGSRYADRLVGGAGNHILRGGDGWDELFGDLASCRASYQLGPRSDDRVYGGGGGDRIEEYWGSDRAHGGTGHDGLYLFGDEVGHAYGGGASDEIQMDLFLQDGLVADGGPGRDRVLLRVPRPLHGGHDTSLVVEQATGAVTLTRFDGTSYTSTVTGVESWGLNAPTTPVAFHGDAESTRLDAGGASLDADMGEGNDSVLGTEGVDHLDGGPGDDRVRATAGVSTCVNFGRGSC